MNTLAFNFHYPCGCEVFSIHEDEVPVVGTVIQLSDGRHNVILVEARPNEGPDGLDLYEVWIEPERTK